MATLKKGSKKLLNAWAFYDWANSVYTLTIASSIFPIFYSSLFEDKNQLVNAFGFEMKQTVLISIVTAFTFLVVACLSPILSGIADYVGNKKNFMKFFCYMGGLGCIGLYFFNLSYIHTSVLFYFMGLLGYWGSLVFYNSYLPDIAFPEQQDSISAKGFSWGYIGSVILLIVNLAMVMSQTDGAAKMQMMKYSFVTVGLWWILFSQYTFY
ncbi:MFS transporter, partial [Seonamhaeicola marinus]